MSPQNRATGTTSRKPAETNRHVGGEVAAGRGRGVHQGDRAVAALPRGAADREGDEQDERQGGEHAAHDQRAAPLQLPDQPRPAAAACGRRRGSRRLPAAASGRRWCGAHAEPPIRVRKASSRRRCGPTRGHRHVEPDEFGDQPRGGAARRDGPAGRPRRGRRRPRPGRAATLSTTGSRHLGRPCRRAAVSPEPTISATGPAWTSRPRSMTTRWVQVCSTSASRWLETMTVRPGRRVADQHLAHLADLRRVEAVGRLVEDEQVRQAEHGLGDGEALPHALASRCAPRGPARRRGRRSPGPRPGGRPRRAGRWPASTAPGCRGRTGAAGSRRPRRTRRRRDSTGRAGPDRVRRRPGSRRRRGVIRPISMRSVVVLPAPFGPSRPSTWPCSTRKDRSRTAYRSADLAYRLLSPVICSGTSASAGSGGPRARSAAAGQQQGGGGEQRGGRQPPHPPRQRAPRRRTGRRRSGTVRSAPSGRRCTSAGAAGEA